jgi:tetratricopeptide (TPR) repeat protein
VPLGPGDHIDRFILEALVGQGGMGSVYRARDPKLQRRVALKILRVEPDDPDRASEGTARLLREARAAAALEHPNAVAIYDVGELDGRPYIAMELVEGKNLRAYVGDPSVPVGDRLRWLLDVARALAAAHRRGLVHRDVKPENVMVRTDGVVKVLDFGIARRHSVAIDPTGGTTPEGLSTITQEGTVVGTPLYMAPEQLRGDALDGRADQFAWGVMAYELLSGRLPWKFERDAFRLVAAILTSAPEPLDRHAPGVPGAVASAVERAIAKEPQARFASMEELVATVELATTSPIALAKTERMPGVEATTARVRRVPRWAIAAGAAAVGAAAFLGVVALRHAPPAPAAAPSASAEPLPADPMAVTDVPPPQSASPEAAAAWRAAMQAFRDGASAAWLEYMRRALAADPSLAAAHLRMAWMTEGASPSEARQHYAMASHLRASLSARDQELLDAAEPYFFRQPSDVAELARRLEAVVSRRPRDAELLFFLARANADRGELATSAHLLSRAVDVDPKFAMALAFRGVDEAYLGDRDASEDSFARCLDAAPGATLCLQMRATVDELEGRCARIEQDARSILAIDPAASEGQTLLAESLLSTGRPLDAVRATLEQRWAHLPEGARAEAELVDRVRLAELEGDLGGAEKRAIDLASAIASPDDADGHARAAWLLVQVATETGDDRTVRDASQRFLARREAWTSNPRGEDWALAADVAPMMLAAQRRTGAIDDATFQQRRDAWLADWESRLPSFYSYDLWLRGFASVVESPDDARRAIAVMERFGVMRAYGPILTAAADEGHAWLLSGDAARALPLLERATSACTELREPIATARAWLWLGQAREALGDKAGACAAYAAASRRWIKATPRARTVELASSRASALACARRP